MSEQIAHESTPLAILLFYLKYGKYWFYGLTGRLIFFLRQTLWLTVHCFYMMCLLSRKGQKHCKNVLFPHIKDPSNVFCFFKRQIKGQKHPICLWENAVEFLCRYSFHRIYTESAHLSIFVTENTTIPNINEVKENMTMGTTLVVNPDGSGFLVGNICGCVLHCYFSHC